MLHDAASIHAMGVRPVDPKILTPPFWIFKRSIIHVTVRKNGFSMNEDQIEQEPELTLQSVTLLLRRVRTQDQIAIADLWIRYWTELVKAAQRQCQFTTALVDPEFIAQSVFNDVCNQFQRGKIGSLTDREQFWAVLLNLTKNKAIDHCRRESRQKRGGNLRRVEAASQDKEGFEEYPFIDHQGNKDKDVSELLEHFQFLLDTEDPSQTLKQIFLSRLAGESNAAIAEHQGVSIRTIDRKLERIRLTLESSAS